MKWIRAAARSLLRLWYRSGRKCGAHYNFLLSHGGALGEPELLVAGLPSGARLLCDLREQIPRLIYFEGVYEPSEAFVFDRLLRPGWTFLDAGANVGQYALLAAPVLGSSGRIFAFEPVPGTAAALRRNLALNKFEQVQVEEAALWHHPGTLNLGLAIEDANVSGGFSVGLRRGERELARELTAPAVVFDDYASMHGIARVDLIKMDIEGAEWFALQGMQSTLHRDRPLLLMEVSRPNAERMGVDIGSIWALLNNELGYQALSIGMSAAACVPLSNLDDIHHRNVLFHAGPLPDGLLDGWTFRDAMRWGRSGWDIAAAQDSSATLTSVGSNTRHNAAGANSTR